MNNETITITEELKSAALSDLRNDAQWDYLSRAGVSRSILTEAKEQVQSTLSQIDIDLKETRILLNLTDIDDIEASRRDLRSLRAKRGALTFLRLLEQRLGKEKTQSVGHLIAGIQKHRYEMEANNLDPEDHDRALWALTTLKAAA